MLQIEANRLAVITYTELRVFAGMQPYFPRGCRDCACWKAFLRCGLGYGKPVGIACVVGDGRAAFLIKGVAVHPDWWDRGTGRLMMEHSICCQGICFYHHEIWGSAVYPILQRN